MITSCNLLSFKLGSCNGFLVFAVVFLDVVFLLVMCYREQAKIRILRGNEVSSC
jgi:hypothetical protein